jgi:chromosome segregation ATPase
MYVAVAVAFIIQEKLSFTNSLCAIVESQKLELEKIDQTIRQCDIYQNELKAKISVTKRVTLKAEEDIGKVEDQKKKQDFLIDHLTTQLRQLQETLATYEIQLLSQQKETGVAHETLQEAAMEMEAIAFEKKQLLGQWKSSLIGLQKRDDMVRSIETSIL